jgi:hypothetical protein
VLLLARVGTIDAEDQRKHPRSDVRLETVIEGPDSGFDFALIINLSAGGFLAQTPINLPVGSELWIEFADSARMPASVRWRGDGLLGCEFDEPLPEALFARLKGESEPE